MAVKPIPEGYHTVTPYLIVENADRLIEFIEQVFGGQLKFKMQTDDGKISHGEMKIGDSMLMLAEASDEWKPTRTLLHLYVDDVDVVYQKALQAGAVSIKEPKDQFYGDRSSAVEDSFGNQWGIATHLEEVSEKEVANRITAQAQTAASETNASAG